MRVKVSPTVFPVGTIIACPGPDCGVGLYKVTTRATTRVLVLHNDLLLVPLNRTVPPRDVWPWFACPFCGSRFLKDRKVHTLQQGWV